MKADAILLRLGELTLKGRNRSRFENQALQHIRYVLRRYPNTAIHREFGRIYVELGGESYEEIAAALRKVFGLVSFSPVRRAELDLDSIRETALGVIRELPVRPQTFKVNVRRVNKTFPYGSHEMNHLIGSYVLQHTPELKVDLHNPDKQLNVEIRAEAAYVFCEVVPGLGGFPIGSNGKAMLMLSGGIDSPVAGWLAMRKGLHIEAVHFHSYPYTSERAKEKVIRLTEKLSEYVGNIRLHMVPFTDMQLRLKETAKENLMITLMRRAMFRIVERLAEKQEIKAIVTGESLGQVASQTLSSMYTIGRVTDLPIIQPLIAMDKLEIMQLAERIDTYSISILPYEDCCTLFVPKSPSTNPNLNVVEHIEASMPDYEQLLLDAVNKTELLYVSATKANKMDALL